MLTINHTSKLIVAQLMARENQTNRMLLIFLLFFFNETLLLQCNFAHSSISVRSRCVVVVYFIVVVLFHRTVCCELRLPELNITNENERHASVLMVPSSFNTCFFFIYINTTDEFLCIYLLSLYLCVIDVVVAAVMCFEWAERMCAVVTLNRLVGRSSYISCW